MKLQRSFCFLWQIFASFATAPSVSPCANFEFPSLNGSSLTAKEGSDVTLPFKLNFTSCSQLMNLSIEVATKVAQQHIPQCILFLQDGTCLESLNTPKCTCKGMSGMYELKHTLNRSDNWPATWTWSTNIPAIGTRTIRFNVLYPAQVTSLRIYDNQRVLASYADKKSSVEVVCLWENGNPPVTARLLDRHGVEMEGSIYSSGQINYTFPAVGCQDAGLIRCEAPGASHNMTTPLLVKCLPEIQLLQTSTDTTDTITVQLTVRAHTADISKCKMQKLDTEITCSVTSVSGSPPDLVMTVRGYNVTSPNHGRWRLELTNEVGTGYVDLEETETTSHSGSTSTTSSLKTTSLSTKTYGEDDVVEKPSSDHTALIAAFAAVALTVVLTVIAVCRECCKKLGPGQNARHPPPAEELAMHDRDTVEEHGSRQSAHYYMEVPDSPPPSDESSAADVEPPPLPCHGQGNPPDDYLNPEPSRDETQEEGAEWKTVRFYENTQLRSVDAEEAAGGDEDRVSDSTQRAERLSEGSSHGEVVASDNASNASLKPNVNADILESGYVPYAPPLYENTEP